MSAMRAVIVEVTFRSVVAVPDEGEDADTIAHLAEEVTRDNMGDIMLAAERIPGLQIKTIKQATAATEVLEVFALSENDDPVLCTCGGYVEPFLSDIFPEKP